MLLAAVFLILPASAQAPQGNSWIAVSNGYTNMLLSIAMKHQPVLGSRQGLSQYDPLIQQPTLADEDEERQEGRARVQTGRFRPGA
jgi:hypothetical protein